METFVVRKLGPHWPAHWKNYSLNVIIIITMHVMLCWSGSQSAIWLFQTLLYLISQTELSFMLPTCSSLGQFDSSCKAAQQARICYGSSLCPALRGSEMLLMCTASGFFMRCKSWRVVMWRMSEVPCLDETDWVDGSWRTGKQGVGPAA